MCAFTLLVSASFAFPTLHASSLQSGYTAVVKAMRSPAGDQTGPLAPPLIVVSWRFPAPVASAIQSCPPLVKATHFPSGDQRASVALVPASGNCRAAPPATGITHVRVVRLFAAMSVVRTA